MGVLMMLAAERRQFVLSILGRDGKVSSGELSRQLGVSEDTVRRDLRELAEAGLLQRVHGGALPLTPVSPSYEVRQGIEPEVKAVLGRAAAGLVRPGMVVIIDAGTTALAVAEHLAPDLRATVITNSPPVAAALATRSAVEVVLLGGRLLKPAVATVGSTVTDVLRRVRADLCFLGVCALHTTGIGALDWEEAQVKQAMIANSAEVVALVPADRLGTTAPYLVAPVRELTHLVTEAPVPAERLVVYEAEGVEIIRA